MSDKLIEDLKAGLVEIEGCGATHAEFAMEQAIAALEAKPELQYAANPSESNCQPVGGYGSPTPRWPNDEPAKPVPESASVPESLVWEWEREYNVGDAGSFAEYIANKAAAWARGE